MSLSINSADKNLIACARCAHLKTRCDRETPCSRCVAKGYECEPRYQSRKTRTSLRQTRANQASTATSTSKLLEPAQSSCTQQLPDLPTQSSAPDVTNPPLQIGTGHCFDALSPGKAGQQPPRASPVPSELAEFLDMSDPAFMQWSVFGDSLANPHEHFYLAGDTVMQTDPDPGLKLSASTPWNPPFYSHLSPILQNLSSSSASVQSPESQQSQSIDRSISLPTDQIQLTVPIVDPTSGSDLVLERWPFVRCNAEQVRPGGTKVPQKALENLAVLLADRNTWDQFEYSSPEVKEPLPDGARDCLVAAVQLLLYRAMQNHQSSSGQGAKNDPRPSILGPVVMLPPSHVFVHYVALYAARIEPCLGLASSSQIRINDILQVNVTDVGSLLVTLLIAQGAMLMDHSHSLILADGLTEACRLAVSDALRSRSIAEPMVGGSALQLITLCAWSGTESFTSFAMAKRAQYLSMLEPARLLHNDGKRTIATEFRSNPEKAYKLWRKQESRSRLAYAWVYVDLELSLLYDVAPMLPINDLHVPLPHGVDLWYSESAATWLGYYKSDPTRLDEELQSLNGLFRSFIHGRLAHNADVPSHHLRLLLHPLQAMVLDQQQLLRVFGKDEPSYSHRALSKLKVLGRLQETGDMLHQMGSLLSRVCQADDAAGRTSAHTMNRLNLIIFHLISLNTLTCIPEIERIARRDPPGSAGQRGEMWQCVRYSESSRWVLCHAGQIFRLIEELQDDGRPPWWPIAAYRAAMACWSLSSSDADADKKSPATEFQPEISINTLPPDDGAMDKYLHDHLGTAILTLPDRSTVPVLQGNNSLDYCIGLLDKSPTRLVRGTQAKLRLLAQRWAI